MVKVKDVNVKTKHVKPRQEGESGQIVKVEAPIHHSQVQPVTADGQVRSRRRLQFAAPWRRRRSRRLFSIQPAAAYSRVTCLTRRCLALASWWALTARRSASSRRRASLCRISAPRPGPCKRANELQLLMALRQHDASSCPQSLTHRYG